MPVPAPRLDLAAGYFLTSDDELCPITTLLNAEGEATADPTQAVVFEARATECWITGLVANFPPVTLH